MKTQNRRESQLQLRAYNFLKFAPRPLEFSHRLFHLFSREPLQKNARMAQVRAGAHLAYRQAERKAAPLAAQNLRHCAMDRRARAPLSLCESFAMFFSSNHAPLKFPLGFAYLKTFHKVALAQFLKGGEAKTTFLS